MGCGLGLRTREICMRFGRQDLTAAGVLRGGVCRHDLLLVEPADLAPAESCLLVS